jgi:hypothetical protein
MGSLCCCRPEIVQAAPFFDWVGPSKHQRVIYFAKAGYLQPKDEVVGGSFQFSVVSNCPLKTDTIFLFFVTEDQVIRA